ncbi:PLP-dependent aminotransferase family protein [Neorhodopirellula pilleata]|uniref:Selenocysteine synthase n=1 Tax=Neorhodopirellula pilleata TaxID=2714738 RepID=A0A5C6A6D7_9BACT|nr:hypothetical protein [Neorhodopirellula pilleata]TWT95542.1 selenocysteine synthase [Neorhodopirellula pilleata]
MALPPWTVELLRRGVQDLARQATDPETAATIKDQAAKLVDELPRVAREKVQTLLKQAESTAGPLKDAWNRGDWSVASLWTHAGQPNAPIRLINGSGTLLSPVGSGVAYSSAVQSAAIPFLSGDAGLASGFDETLRQQLATSLQMGDSRPVSAFVAGSLDRALAMIGSLTQPGCAVYVPRRCAVAMPGVGGEGFLVDRLQSHVRGPVREFGGIDPEAPLDIHAIAAEHTTRSPSSERRLVVVSLAGTPINYEGLPENASRVVVIPAGTFFTDGGPVASIASVESELASGADVVVLAGGVLTDTPSVGIIVGNPDHVRRMTDHRRANFLAAPVMQIAMVAAAVAQQRADSSPVKKLASVSEDNLRDRAERLATQLAAAASVRSVRVTDQPAQLGGVATASLPSRQVVLTSDQSPETLAAELLAGPVGLLTTVVENDLAIDLRWITPEQQAKIGQRFR